MLSTGDVAIAGVGCSDGSGLGAVRAGRGVAPGAEGDFVASGLGVFSGLGVAFFFPDDVPLAGLVFSPPFLFAVLDFGVAEGLLDGFGEGVG